MKKAEIMFDAITGIREHLVEEAQNYRFRRRQPLWRRYAGWAACLLLVAFVGFGAVRLGVFGGMGGSSANSAPGNAAEVNGATQDSAAADENSGAGWDGEASPGDTEGDAAGGSSDRGDFEAGQRRLTATVLEVHEGYLLVEPVEGDAVLASADRVMVSIDGLEEIPDLEAGDRVSILFDGMIMESYPAKITGVTAIELLPEEP